MFDLGLEQIKKLQEDRAISRPLEPQEIPVGMGIMSEDGENKATIISVCGGKRIFLSGPVMIDGKETLEVSAVELKANWLLETPNGLMICGVPDDSGIITPNQAANNGGFSKIEV